MKNNMIQSKIISILLHMQNPRYFVFVVLNKNLLGRSIEETNKG